ncbi:MAG TPA: 50S ribosomal protein L3 [Bacillota bacterium]|nr:50S ribosomal protein L3 [Bacillota bacterium]HOY89681.1 50S ribosomal protein L3 [Bacillota bacterium]HPI01732.1 50S ribosomal protein L3 [Bacillota bacterium]HPM64177.1 50S ribosomal protein L3 [Bacillota bacterium]
MAKAILGKKLGMTQIFATDGKVTPVTVIEAGPCVVVQRKTEAHDGYEAIQVGFGQKRERLFTKAEKGHFAKANIKPMRYLREFRVESSEAFTLGQEIKADLFTIGDKVDVTGKSRGKGFAGVIKRHNFNRGAMSHGSMYHRRVGSLGATDPARVFKGRKMPGRMGGERVTIQGLTVAGVDIDRNLILVRGAIPGTRGGLVVVKDSVKASRK